MQPRSQRILTVIGIAAAAFVCGLVLKLTVLGIWLVPSDSMAPTLQSGDVVLAVRPGTSVSQLHRGDVIGFADPGGWMTDDPDDHSHQLVKRVIGLPGEHVSCTVGSDTIEIDGRHIVEPYLDQPACTVAFDVTVPEHAVWMMGDNRSDSADSRYHQDTPSGGFVSDQWIRGRVVGILSPFQRITQLPRTQG
ncbi:signal peptidase I [Pseudoclavibacter sp. CFCC 13796]|uniref:signal peptidase I n=1 Tax=Pseudoclavibacter sp. CFCC 13796 TaxID=2615179 RepID=UPI0017879C24|nr:signal peptidase I [Pseudoclavibacter sp. CFCC 13796]